MTKGYINHLVREWSSAVVKADVAKRFTNPWVTVWSIAGVRIDVHKA